MPLGLMNISSGEVIRRIIGEVMEVDVEEDESTIG
jgi:hypothetical protein